MVGVVKIIAGGAIVGFTLREMFHDLFHPSVSGSLSEWVGHAAFGLLRRWPRSLPLAAPLAIVLIIFIWANLLAGGFALVYWALPARCYQIDPGAAGPQDGFAAAFYFSLEIMTTLGLGDVKPIPEWLRVMVTLHTLLGFAMVSASLTWILLIFPALSRTNTLALAASSLAEAERRSGVEAIAVAGAGLLQDLAEGLIQFRVDVVNYPILYYFRSQHDDACIAASICHIDRIASQAMEPQRGDGVRLYGNNLVIVLEQVARVLSSGHKELKGEDRSEIFQAFAHYHAVNGRR